MPLHVLYVLCLFVGNCGPIFSHVSRKSLIGSSHSLPVMTLITSVADAAVVYHDSTMKFPMQFNSCLNCHSTCTSESIFPIINDVFNKIIEAAKLTMTSARKTSMVLRWGRGQLPPQTAALPTQMRHEHCLTNSKHQHIQGAAKKSSPLKFFAVFSATTGNFNLKFYRFIC